MAHEPVIPEPIGDYPLKCADVGTALTIIRERIEEWDRSSDPHGWWHERPALVALYNAVINLQS